MGLNPFPLSNELEFDMVVDTIQKEIRVTMDAEKYPVEIHYTTDGSTPTASSPIYQEPIVVKDSAKIVAGIFVNGQLQDRVSEQRVDYHKGIGKSIRFNSRLYPGYMAGGINAIINGCRGGLTYLDQSGLCHRSRGSYGLASSFFEMDATNRPWSLSTGKSRSIDI